MKRSTIAMLLLLGVAAADVLAGHLADLSPEQQEALLDAMPALSALTASPES